jgi:hypothetical protein
MEHRKASRIPEEDQNSDEATLEEGSASSLFKYMDK